MQLKPNSPFVLMRQNVWAMSRRHTGPYEEGQLAGWIRLPHVQDGLVEFRDQADRNLILYVNIDDLE